MNVIALYKTYDLSFQKWDNFLSHSVSWKSEYIFFKLNLF